MHQLSHCERQFLCALKCGHIKNNVYYFNVLVMRSKGSMRLVLNTKIWADMSLTRANKKSIRISARTQDDEIGVFLLQVLDNKIESYFWVMFYK